MEINNNHFNDSQAISDKVEDLRLPGQHPEDAGFAQASMSSHKQGCTRSAPRSEQTSLEENVVQDTSITRFNTRVKRATPWQTRKLRRSQGCRNGPGVNQDHTGFAPEQEGFPGDLTGAGWERQAWTRQRSTWLPQNPSQRPEETLEGTEALQAAE
jgi:hypothetical protein